MAITKPPVLPSWAEAGDKVQPSNAEIQAGWPLSSIPPSRQRFNWLLNFLANGIRYFSRRGLPDYDAAETYMTGDLVIGDDGKTYRSLIDNNSGQTPSAEPTKWERWALTRAEADLRVQNSSASVGAPGGSSDAIIGTYVPAITALANGMVLYVRAGAANATTTPTFTPATGVIPAKVVEKGEGVALVAGDISGSGHMLALQYDQTNDKWRLLNPATPPSTVTAGNDATFSSNGNKPASTSWIRGAMSAIATAAGFAISTGGSGYIKFPSWLGGWIVQWVQVTGTSLLTASWPIAFPTGCRIVFPAVIDALVYAYVSSYTPSQVVIGHNKGSSGTVYVLGIGH